VQAPDEDRRHNSCTRTYPYDHFTGRQAESLFRIIFVLKQQCQVNRTLSDAGHYVLLQFVIACVLIANSVDRAVRSQAFRARNEEGDSRGRSVPYAGARLPSRLAALSCGLGTRQRACHECRRAKTDRSGPRQKL